MHRCFELNEIVDAVVDILAGRNDRLSRSQSSLAALARTCKAFLEPALDALWEEQQILDNLLKCMPPHTWSQKIGLHGKPQTAPELKLSTGANDWDRFRFYSSRVRNLLIIPKHIPTSTLQALAHHQACTGSELFPRLSNLWWSASGSEDKGLFLTAFLGPTLTTLDLVDITPEAWPTCESSLTYLPSLCPSLKALGLRSVLGATVATSTSRLDAVFNELRNLQSLALYMAVPSDAHPLDAISVLPRLEHLFLHDYFPAVSMFRHGPNRPQNPFPRLRVLEVASVPGHLTSLSAFIREYAPQRLQKVYLFDAIGDSSSISIFMRTLADYVAHDSLHELRLDTNLFQMQPVDLDLVITHDTLRPLQVFRNLEVLILMCYGHISLNDDVYEAFATSWPSLRILSLSHSGMTRSKRATSLEYPTLKTFATLVKYCPLLQSIGFEVDTVLPPETRSPGFLQPGLSNRLVTTIGVSETEVRGLAPAEIAQYLSNLFPNLTTINAFGDHRDKWQDVEKALPTYVEPTVMAISRSPGSGSESEG